MQKVTHMKGKKPECIIHLVGTREWCVQSHEKVRVKAVQRKTERDSDWSSWSSEKCLYTYQERRWPLSAWRNNIESRELSLTFHINFPGIGRLVSFVCCLFWHFATKQESLPRWHVSRHYGQRGFLFDLWHFISSMLPSLSLNAPLVTRSRTQWLLCADSPFLHHWHESRMDLSFLTHSSTEWLLQRRRRRRTRSTRRTRRTRRFCLSSVKI